ncbi:hypothetical protein EU537_01955 [Candidatus Thorarchaeota archaeon]|nr:MAG: hypothetical protein EU537_01955 [Candidatus Thorarchaeota archaeon]
MSKVITSALLVLLFSMVIVPFVPTEGIQKYSPESSPLNVADEVVAGKVLVDESHTSRGSDMWTPGNASIFGWILMEHGYNVFNNFDQALDSGLLSDYDILCLFFPQIQLTSAEVTAIQNFVSNGGGLLLVGVDHRETVSNYTAAYMNPISEDYGISFNEDDILGRSLRSEGEIEDHFITTNVDSFTSNNDLLYGCSLDVTSPATSLGTIEGEDMLAIHDTGTGRVVAVGSPATFMQYYTEEGWLVDEMDHFELSLNIIDWLMQGEQRTVELPDRAVIKIGDGPDLSPAELENYKPFIGQYHDHTTRSDGQDSPQDMMIAMLDNSLDWSVMTDHSYENAAKNGVFGGLDMRAMELEYGLDVKMVVGAELSAIPHTVGFPLTEQIYTTSTQDAVDAIHAQGGIASFCHPTISQTYVPVWERMDEYGYDAFEVDNSGFLHGLGEKAYFMPFLGANDGHAARKVATVMNVVFIDNPSGEDGKVTNDELIEAVLERRVVVLDKVNNLILGEGIWVDEFLNLWDEANSTIQAAEDIISVLESGDDGISLARSYLEKAKDAFADWNPSRAIKLAENAVSDFILGIDITLPDSIGPLNPNAETTVSVELENRHGYGIEVNCTPFVTESYEFDQGSYAISASAGTIGTTDMTAQTSAFGYTYTMLNIRDLNETADIRPILMEFGGLIENITESTEAVAEGYDLTLELLMNRGGSTRISSVKLAFNDGDTEQTIDMENLGRSYAATLGPYPSGTNVSYTVTVTDKLGNIYVMGEYVADITPEAAAPDILPFAVVGIGVVALVAIIVVFWKKRS